MIMINLISDIPTASRMTIAIGKKISLLIPKKNFFIIILFFVLVGTNDDYVKTEIHD